MLLQLLGRLGQSQVVRHLLKVTSNLILLHANRLEEEHLAVHIDLHERDFPIPRRNLSLFDMKLATFVQVAQQTFTKLHLRDQMPLDLSQPVLLLVKPHLPRHVMKDGGFVRRRVEGGLGLKRICTSPSRRNP